MTPPRRTPYWTLPAFILLILMPAPWATALLATAAAVAAGRGIRARALVRRTEARAASEAIVLGADRRGSTVYLTDRELSAHGLIVGASGAGKSTTLLRILTEQIRRGRPVIAIDMKGSPAFADVLAEAAGAAGRPFVTWSIDGPAHWNPLQHGNATELKDKLIATERFTEPHYQRAAERYVQIVLRVLSESRPGRSPALAEVVDLMDPVRLPRLLRGVEVDLRERIQDYLAGLTGDQLSAIRGLQTRLAVLTESHTAPYLGPPAPSGGGPSIDLRHALQGPEVVLFSLNSSRYGKLAAQLGTLAVQDLVSAAGDRLSEIAYGRRIEPAIIGLDEFSALGADHVIALLSRARESGMSALVATQELVDLERAAPGLRDQVVGVTALKIIHRQETPRSAEMLAQMAGTQLVWEHTRQTASRLIGYDTGRGTRRQVERYVVHPNEIKGLGTGEAIVISKLGDAPPRWVRITPPGVEPPTATSTRRETSATRETQATRETSAGREPSATREPSAAREQPIIKPSHRPWGPRAGRGPREAGPGRRAPEPPERDR